MSDATLNGLLKKYGGIDGVTLDAGVAGMPRVRVSTPLCEGEVYLQGAHVTHFQPAKHEPVLFVSSVPFRPGAAIRGGVPISFPWFAVRRADFDAGPETPPPRHGFARTMNWDLSDIQRAGDETVLRFSLYADDATHAFWPGDFLSEYVVRFGKELQLSHIVHNLGAAPLHYEEALHTYFRVGDARKVTLDGPRWARDLKLDGPTDLVVTDSADTIILHDPILQRSIANEKSSSQSTIVWFPWMPEPGKSLYGDMKQEESTQLLCVETANVGKNWITVLPGAKHVMRARISVGKL